MKTSELIRQARRVFEGDGVLMNPELAYRMLASVADELQGDDRVLFEELRDAYAEEPEETPINDPFVVYVAPMSADSDVQVPVATCDIPLNISADLLTDSDQIPTVANMAATRAVTHSAQEVRDRFEQFVMKATPLQLGKLYDEMLRIEENRARRAESPENKRFGNNLGFLLRQCDYTASRLCQRMNFFLAKRGSKPISRPVITYYIAGKNGVAPENMEVLLMVFNGLPNIGKVMRITPLTREHLYLQPEDFFALFHNPTFD